MRSAPPSTVSRGGGVLIAALVVDSVGNGLFLPLSLIYFTAVTGVSLAQVGVLLSVANAVSLPVPLLAGQLADRFGALRVVIGAQLLQAGGYVWFALVQGPGGILGAGVLTAVGVRFFWSAIFTAVADYADGSGRRRTSDWWFALSNGSRTAGLAVGGLITGLVQRGGRTSGYREVVLTSAICFLLAAVAIGAFVRTPSRERETRTGDGYRMLLQDRPYLGLIGINIIFAMTTMLLPLALPTVVSVGLRGSGLLTSLLLAGNALLIAVLSAPVVRRLSGRRRTRSIMVAAALWSAWSLVFAALRPGPIQWVLPLLIAGTLLYIAADVVHGPISAALASEAAPPAARGRYLAAFQYSFAIASIVGPAFFTMLYARAHAAPWIACAALNLVAIIGLFALESRLPAAATGPAAAAGKDR